MSTLSNRLANGFLKKYHGVQGGVLFRGKAAQKLAESYPALKSMNNALWAAPAWKWGLAIVPLYGVLTGSPVEKVDFNNALGQWNSRRSTSDRYSTLSEDLLTRSLLACFQL
jgi:hypothetical protein